MKYILTILLVSLIFLTGCGQNNQKLPITTSSSEALDYFLKGRSLSERLRTLEAAKMFEEAVAIDSNFALAYLQLAFTVNSPSEFAVNMNKAFALIDSVSEGEQLYMKAIKAGNLDNDNDLMLTNIHKLLALYPEDERARVLLANYHYNRQDYQDAINEFNRILEINPEFSYAYNMMGYAYRFLKNYNQAEAMFKAYIDLIPNDPNPYDSYAELLLEMGEFDRSIEMYQKALSINPYFYFSHVGIAANLNYKGEHVKARTQLQELYRTAKHPSQKQQAHIATAMSYYDQQNFTLAIQELMKRYEVAHEIADTAQMGFDYYLIGNVYYEINELEKAGQMYEKAYALMDNSNLLENIKRNNKYNYYYNKARLAIRKGAFDEARKQIDAYAAIINTTNNVNQQRLLHFLEALFAMAQNDYERAEEELRQSNQQSPYVMYQLGLLFEANGDLEKAVGFYTKAARANLANSFSYIFVRAKAHEKLKTLNAQT